MLCTTGMLFTAAAAGCTDDGPENGTPRPDDDDDDDDDEPIVEIVDHELIREEEGTDEETVAVEGTVEIVDEEAEPNYIEVQARFYDENEELLDSTVEHIEELGEHQMLFRIEFPHVGEQAAAVEGYEVEVTTTL